MSCCHDKKKNEPKSARKLASWLPAFAIALLPKCPLCIIAYSSAISLFTGRAISPDFTIQLTMVLGLICLAGIAFNYRGARTKIALSIGTIGLLGLIGSNIFLQSMVLDFLFIAVLLFGIWYNGSFLHFYSKYFAKNIDKNFTS